MPLHIRSHEKRPTCFEVTLEGQLDSGTSPQLESWFNQLFQNPVRRLQLNMSKVDYVSSAGIRAVLRAMRKMRDCDGSFAMTDLQPAVKKVFEIVHLLPGESLFANEEEADAYFDAIQKKGSSDLTDS